MLEEDLTFAERVYLARRRSRKKPAEFASQWGLTRQQLHDAEKGRRKPRQLRGLTLGGLLGPHEHYLIMRRRAGFNAKELATRMGIHVNTLHMMERGRAPLDRLIAFWGH